MFFVIRHDKAKTARLKKFLSWKDVRKTAKDTDDKGGDADIGGDDPIAGDVPGTGPASGDTAKKNKRNKIILPWDIENMFAIVAPDLEDEEDDEEDGMNEVALQRLKAADERTKNMTKDEYVHFSECRQASFTFRKGKRFREWAGFSALTDSKPNDDIIDCLGFLTFEMVQSLTEAALKFKQEGENFKARKGGDTTQNEKRKRETGLFDPPEQGHTPVSPDHIREAYRRMQHKADGGRSKINFAPPNMPRRRRLQLVR